MKYRRSRFTVPKSQRGRSGLQAELKFIDDARNSEPVASTGAFQTSMVVVAQGDGPSTRDGRKIVVTQITTRMHIFLNTLAAATLPAHDVMIVCMVLDTQVNGTAPSATDYVTTATSSLTFRNMFNTHRFKTLWRREYTIFPHAAAGNGTANHTGETSYDDIVTWKGSIEIIYNNDSTDGVVGTQESNGIFLYFQSRHGQVSINTNSRLRYYG